MTREEALQKYTENELKLRELRLEQQNLKKLVLGEVIKPQPVPTNGARIDHKALREKVAKTIKEYGSAISTTDLKIMLGCSIQDLHQALRYLMHRNLINQTHKGTGSLNPSQYEIAVAQL